MPCLERIRIWINVDSVFTRVCLAIFGSCFVSGLIWALSKSRPEEWSVRIVVGLLFAFGATLILLALRASDARVDRSADLLSDGGDLPVLILLILVAVVAVPVTIFVRSLKRTKR